jgi:hypothetical protein
VMVDVFSDPVIHRERPICVMVCPVELYDV